MLTHYKMKSALTPPSSPSKILRSMMMTGFGLKEKSLSDSYSDLNNHTRSTSSISWTNNSAGTITPVSLEEGHVEMQMLDEFLLDKDRKSELIAELLGRHNNSLGFVMRLRFISAVNEMLRASDRKERYEKCSTIVQIFICEESRFQLKDIPSSISIDLLAACSSSSSSSSSSNSTEALILQLKQWIATELMKDMLIRSVVEDNST